MYHCEAFAWKQKPWLYRVVHGDCRNYLPKLKDGTVDCIITDPPYGINFNDGDLAANREQAMGQAKRSRPPRPIANDDLETSSELVQFLFEQSHRLLKPGGCCCCCCSGGGGKEPLFAKWSLWMGERLSFKQMIVWDKGPMGLGWHYRRSYETILVGQRPGGPCAWYDTSHRVENIIRPGDGIRKIIPRSTDHPTPKPIALAKHFLRLHTRPGDLVLDPFCGAGWVGVACLEMNRRFIGVEVDKRWVSLARRRLKAAMAERAVLTRVAS